MANVRIELNHAGIEEIEDSYSSLALEKARAIQARANGMRSDKSVAEYNVHLRPGRKGGRHYAVVSADAPSTARDNARYNTLAKAMG